MSKLVLFLIASLSLQAGSVSKDIKKIVKKYIASNNFAGTILVKKENRTLFHRAYGYASIEHKVKNKITTSYHLASLGKQFTAAAILRLQEEGKLSIDDNINSYIKEAPEKWNQIKIKHLLNHSSGLIHWPFTPEYLEKFGPPSNIQHWLNASKDKDLVHTKPGSKMSYSNLGYLLLGEIVQKASGLGFEEYLKKAFYKPLGMKNTGEYSLRKVIPNQASPYIVEGGKLQRGCCYRYTPYGAGSTYSTTRDLMTWFNSLLDHTILSKSSVDLLFARSIPDSKPGMFYGYGWMIDDWNSMERIQHSGGGYGFISLFTHIKAQDLTIIQLSNMDNQDPTGKPWYLRVMRNEILELFK